MKRGLLLAMALISMQFLRAQTITYSTSSSDWTNTWRGSSGLYQATGGPGLFSFGTNAGNGDVNARLLTSNGTTGGTAAPLQPGQKLILRVAAPVGGGRTGIQSGGRIGFSLRSSNDVFAPSNATQAFDRYDNTSLLRVEFEGGQASAQIIDQSGPVRSGMPGFTDFVNGQTYEIEVLSDREFNLQVVGGTRYNVLPLRSTGLIRQVTLFNVGENRDGVFTQLAVETLSAVSVTSNSAETKTLAGVISNNGATTNNVEKLGSGLAVLTGQNTYTGLTTVQAGTLQLNRAGGGTLPATNAAMINNTGTLRISTDQSLSNVTLNAGGTLSVDAGATLTITGTFTGGGTITNNGRIVLAGAASQTFPGSGTTVSAMNQLEIANGNGVTLTGNLSVSGGLALTNGRLNIGNQILTLNSGATLTGGSASSYIVTGTGAGRLRRNNLPATATNFPVGTTNYYLPVSLTPSTAGSDFAVSVFEGATSDGTANGAPLPSGGIVNATWNVDRPNGSSAATLTVNWNAALEGSSFSNYADNQVGISRYNGSSWETATATSASNTTNSATATFSQFSPFGVGLANVVLPVRFYQLSGERQANGWKLTWLTQATQQVKEFWIERSGASGAFQRIGSVPVQNGAQQRYEWTDNNTGEGMLLYRIVAVAIDGKRAYSTILRLESNGKGAQLLAVPVSKGNIQLQWLRVPKGNATLLLYAADGRVVLQRAVAIQSDAQIQSLALPALAPGIYTVVLWSGTQKLTQTVWLP